MSKKPLTVAHFNTERTWRGGEQQAFSLIKGLNKKGITNWAVCLKDSLFAKKLKHADININEVSPFGEWDFISAHFVNRWLSKNNIDVIHAHAPHAAGLAALSSLGTKIPVLFSRRVDFHLKKNIFSRWKYKRATRILAISNGVKDVLIEDGIPEEKIDLVPSGVEFSKYNNVQPIDRSMMRVPQDTFVIGQVAALEDHKDQETFLKALALLKDDYPQIRAVIVGDGSYRTRLENLAKELKLGPMLRFLGFQPNPLHYLAAFDVFCLSSKLEGLGTSLLDAMALQIPVVATRTGGIPEIVEDGVTGYLVPPQDPDRLAKSLSLLARAKEKDQKMCDRAYEKAREFDVIHTIEKTEQIYRSVVK